MAVAKRQRKEKACENSTKEGLRTRVGTSGETNSPPGQPNLHRAGLGGGEKKHIKRGAKIEPGVSLHIFQVGPPSCLEDVFSSACQIKLSCNTSPSVTSNFCCHETEPRKLQTLLTYPWNSLGKDTGMDCHFLLQGIFLTQGSNPGLLHCRQILYHLSHQESSLLKPTSILFPKLCRNQ